MSALADRSAPNGIGGIALGLLILALAFRPTGAQAASRSVDAPRQADETPLGPQCHPNCALVCVPIASDVRGPVKVIGMDVCKLDRDGDGIACEPKQ